MKDDKPYIDEQWDDLPLPDADNAWQRMELLLDDDKKRRRVLPFWFWRYTGLGLLLAGMAIGGWLWLKSGAENEPTTQKQLSKQNDVVSEPASEKPMTNRTATTTSSSKKEQPTENNTILKAPQKRERKQDLKDNVAPEKSIVTKSALPKKSGGSIAKTKTTPQQVPDDDPVLNDRTSPKQTQPKRPANSLTEQQTEIKKTVLPPKDSVVKKDTVAVKAAEPVAGNEPVKKEQKKNNPFVLSAGIGLQQAIALKSQESSAFNYNGKRSTASDLIPSVYLRLQKGKWFAQAEFQYAVPQPVEQFSFSQKTTYDVAALNVNTERTSIQKLYYHQLPFSINYHVLPNWSVGAGAMYNVLAGAVTEQEVQSKNVQTGAEATTRALAPVKGYKDSFLYKTTAGILVQTDYHWKRFSLGMRFTQNLQPFIKYTRPDGTILDEKNRVLQAILRFRLF